MKSVERSAAAADDKSESRAIVDEALERFRECQKAEQENRARALESIRFSVGEQWPDTIRKDREADGRPCLTINKMPTHIRQVVNDARQNRPQMKVTPIDGRADPETAKIYDGILRHIQAHSHAEDAYDTAIESAVRGGFGFFRLVTDYSQNDTFDLDIFIRRVPNPFTIYLDPARRESTAEDMGFAFVFEDMRKATFEAKYPDARTGWDGGKGVGETYEGWFTDESVRVAEYWRRIDYPRELALLDDNTTIYLDKGVEREVLAQGKKVVRTRTVICKRVEQHILTAHEVLSSKTFPGQWIPIFPAFGEEVNIEGKFVLNSLIQHSMDAQRMFNYWRTAATERVALEPKAPFIGPLGSFDSDRTKWNQANAKNYAYIEYDPVPGAPPPQRQGPPQGAAAYINEALASADDIKSTMGQFDASLGARSNETSGRAIMARQREGDVSTFHFIDNLAKSIRHCGKVLLEWLPEVYTGERVVRVLGEDGQAQMQAINRAFVGKGGQPMVYDISRGKYDLEVKVGPSYTTQREEAASRMSELVRAQPRLGEIAGDLIIGKMDIPGATEIAERIKRTLPPHLTAEGDAPPQLPPQVQQMMQQGKQQIQNMGAEIQHLQAELQKSQADLATAQANAAHAGAAAQSQKAQLDLRMKEMEVRGKELDLQAKQVELRRKEVELAMAAMPPALPPTPAPPAALQ